MTAAGMSKEIHLVSFGLNYSMIKTYLKVIYILVESIKNAGGLLISRPSSVLDMSHMSIHGRKNQKVRSFHAFLVIRDLSQSPM